MKIFLKIKFPHHFGIWTSNFRISDPATYHWAISPCRTPRLISLAGSQFITLYTHTDCYVSKWIKHEWKIISAQICNFKCMMIFFWKSTSHPGDRTSNHMITSQVTYLWSIARSLNVYGYIFRMVLDILPFIFLRQHRDGSYWLVMLNIWHLHQHRYLDNYPCV